jgi:sulfonate transport system permease protein
MSASATLRAPIAGRDAWRSTRLPVLIVAAVLLLWTGVAWVFEGRYILPYPWTLAGAMASDWDLLTSNAQVTLGNAALGLLWAVAAVVPLAVLCFLLPVSQPTVMIVATVVHVIPTVAIAPILIVGITPEPARIVIAALQVYFPLLVGLLLGLRSADRTSLDVVTASGGREWARIRFLRLQSALPSLIAALQIAVPAAVLGALIGEFFGSAQGLGAVLLSAQEHLLVDRVWGIGVFAGIVAALGFGAVTLLARILVPWAGKGASVGTSVAGAESQQLGSLRSILSAGVAIGVIVAFWYSLRFVFGFNPYFVKTPDEVLRYLIAGDPMSGAGPEAFWDAFTPALGETLLDAVIGFIAGTVLAIVGAVVLVGLPRVSQVVMPMAILLRSIPLLAMLPVVAIVFGRGLLAVTIIVVLVTFFPTLVNVMAGLRAAPEGAIDLIRASGGSGFAVARRVRVAYAFPSIIASAQIALPAAIAGATLAEWMVTGKGIGYLLTLSSVRAQYLQLWSSSILLVVIVLIVYGVLGVVSGWITRRIGISD